MKTIREFENLLKFAIREEKKAQDLYGEMANKAKDPFVKTILEGLREEEMGHEAKLLKIMETIKPTVS